MHARRLVLLMASLASLLLLPTQVLAASASVSSPTTVVFVGGYGSSLASATLNFAPLRAALLAHDSATTFAQFSYQGWNAQTCEPLNYTSADTGQDLGVSERKLLDTVYLLSTQCAAGAGGGRVVLIGHSLGGLIAFHALSDNSMHQVSDIVTVDSPLGGAPASAVDMCIDTGMCAEGPVGAELARLFGNWDQTARDNATRVSRLANEGIRVTAWGNQDDCLYAPTVCVPL